jgi:hypothetical protein
MRRADRRQESFDGSPEIRCRVPWAQSRRSHGSDAAGRDRLPSLLAPEVDTNRLAVFGGALDEQSAIRGVDRARSGSQIIASVVGNPNVSAGCFRLLEPFQ